MSDTHNTGGSAWRNDPFSSASAQQAFDPWLQPELFRGVLTKRVFAFIIDLVVLSIPIVLAIIFIALFGIVTLGLGFVFYALLSPIMILWALFYYGVTLGGRHSATIGMRAMDIEMRTWYGSPAYFVLGAVHAIVFWISVSVFTPLVLLVCLFNERRRCLHDILIGTVIINNEARAGMLRATARPPG